MRTGRPCSIRALNSSEVISRREDGPVQLSREDLVKAYRQMCTIRAFEEGVHVEFAGGGIPGFVHLYAGEAASAVGVCLHLTDRDSIASTHSGHGPCIAKD